METSKLQRGKAWFWGAVFAAGAGGAMAVVFSAWWLAEVRTHCGVVRFYEQVFALILCAGWFGGIAVGLLVAFFGRRRSWRMAAAGFAIVIMINIAAAVVWVRALHGIKEADYTLKSKEELLGYLTADNLDRRVLSAHALGVQRAVEALPLLCTILENDAEDLNLRHNAAIALGRICAPPLQNGVDFDRAIASLTSALNSRDEYLPSSVVQALGDIGDSRTVEQLARCLADESRPVWVREDAARALGKIGSEESLAALAMASNSSSNQDLRNNVQRILNSADHTRFRNSVARD